MRRILAIPRAIVHALLSPFRSVRNFLTEVPDDTSLTETLGDALDSRDSFLGLLGGLGEHLDALRRHLLRSVIVLAIATGLCFLFAGDLMKLLAVPLGAVPAADSAPAAVSEAFNRLLAQGADGLAKLQVIEPTESVGVFMRVSLLAGVALAMPWIVLEVFLFVAPGLMPRSRWFLMFGIPVASVFFLLGLLFCYFFMLPAAIPFLYNFMNFRSAWRPSAYFELVTTLMFWVGVTFEMPLVAYLLGAVGLVRARQLAAQWRIAVVAIAVVAAAITPTTDPVNMAMVMVPMLGLYLVSILAAGIAGSARGKSAVR
jgi:sec-independent protein translocase protein TatC